MQARKLMHLKSLRVFSNLKHSHSPIQLNSDGDSEHDFGEEYEEDYIESNRVSSFSFIEIFKPVEGYYITPILIILNILIFIVMALSGVHVLDPAGQDLLVWGANYRPLTLDGQWWRLFTACFIHIGVMHVLFNMYALYYIGILLERHIGKFRFLAAYILSGIAASVISLWWHDLIISAGASGANFGMYGVFLALMLSKVLDQSIKKDSFTSILVFVAYNLIYGLRPDSGIDNAAHIGGLLSGMLIGFAFVPSLNQFDNKKLKMTTIGLLTLVVIGASGMAYNAFPKDIVIFDNNLAKFEQLESKALSILEDIDLKSDDVILHELKNIGIPIWKEGIELFESMENLELPANLQETNSKIKEYCKLRLATYELYYKGISENTDLYIEETDSYYERINQILNDL